jgi:hypothetical protein
MTSIRIPQLVSFLFSSIAAVAQSLPEPPTLWREVTGIINTTVTDPSGTQKTVPVYRQAHVPSYRTTVDGRVALRVLNDGGFALMMPEKLSAPVRLASAHNNPVNNSYAMSSTASPKFVDGCKSAKENVAKFHSAQGNGSVGHFTLFDPTPLQSTGGVVGNPSCDDFGSDVYKLKVFAIFNYDPSHQLHPNKMQFFVTPVTVIVDKPKTKDANIKSVTTSGAPVAGPIYHFQAAGNEPNIVGDGRLLVLRIGATKLPWTNPITGVGQQKPVDIVYSYYEGGDPADPRMWTNLHPITHAPHDPRINGKFGFAMNRFRDPSGREIPDGADLGGTYPWIDRQAKNLFFNVVSETLRYSVPNSQGKDDWSDPRNSRYEQRKLAGDPDLDGAKEEASKTRGICFAGLWSHGKVVLLDNLNNDMDYAMGDGTKLGAREVRLFDPTQFEAAPNHREWLHLGAGRVNNADAMPAGEHKNNTVMDSLENVFNYRKFAEPISIGEVVWPLHNGKHSDDLVFDNYLDHDAFIVANMSGFASFVQGTENSLSRFNYYSGWNHANKRFGGAVRLQNAATSTRWAVPQFGSVTGPGRLEPAATGGIHGKGFWMDGKVGLEFKVPAQDMKVSEADWYVGIFVDCRHDNDATERRLLSFPDGTSIRLYDRKEVRYFNGKGQMVPNISMPSIDDRNPYSEMLPDGGWAHLAWQIRSGGKDVEFLLNGLPYHRFGSDQPLFQLSPGKLTVGAVAGGVRGWIDDFIVLAHTVNFETACNHAGGTLIGLTPQSEVRWQYFAQRFPADTHEKITNSLPPGATTYPAYANFSDYGKDYGAHLGNIPEGTVSLRQKLHYPEGPLHHNRPRPDSATNAFCLTCHSDAGKGGLSVDALKLNTSLNADKDPRRQPSQPYPRIFGAIPAGLIDKTGMPTTATKAKPTGDLIDRWLLPAAK